jgi:hypothetical protein
MNAWMLKALIPAGVSATSTSVGDPAYVFNDYAGVVWQARVGDAPVLTIDLGADMPVDTIMLFGLRAFAAATAKVQISLATAAQGSGFGTGQFWTSAQQSLVAGSVMPTSGKGVMLWVAPDVAAPPASVRYVRLSFLDLGPAGTVQVARAVVGQRIQLSRNFGYGAAFGLRDLGSVDFSRRGVLLRTRGAKLRTLGLSFSNIAKDEVEATTRPLMEQLGNTETVALVTDPAADAQRQNRCYFGFLVGDLSHTWRNAAAFEAKINLVSIF